MKRNTFIKSCAAAFGVGVTSVKAGENETLDIEKLDKDALYKDYMRKSGNSFFGKTARFRDYDFCLVHIFEKGVEKKTVAGIALHPHQLSNEEMKEDYRIKLNNYFCGLLGAKFLINENNRHTNNFISQFNESTSFTLQNTGKNQFTLSRKTLA
jgi:hypothetical protein